MFLILSYFVRYPKLIKIGWGRRFFVSWTSYIHSFYLPRARARADRYVLHFSLTLPFLPRTTRVDVPVFLLPLAPSFCSTSLLPTDYAPVVDVHRHRLPRFASSHLFPFSVSFPFLQRREEKRSGSKYILSLLQQSSISVPRRSQPVSRIFPLFPCDSARSDSRSVSPIYVPSFPIPYKPFSISFRSSRILLHRLYGGPKVFILTAHSWINFRYSYYLLRFLIRCQTVR